MASKGSDDVSMQALDKNGNAYKVRITLMTSDEKEKRISGLLIPFDRGGQIVDVNVKTPDDVPLYADKVNAAMKSPGRCITPALCVLAYRNDHRLVARMMRTSGWKHHHTVEGKHKQVFFQLENDNELPLFASVEDPTDEECLVFQIYVRKYKSMKAFYSEIAEAQEESSVDGLCVFELYKKANRLIKLKLKECQYIYPVPAKSAYISFNVTNVGAIEARLGLKFERDIDNVYSTTDPDGNVVVLYETSKKEQDAFAELADKYEDTIIPALPSAESLSSFDDVTSVLSTSDSNDSGTASDVDSQTRGSTNKRQQPKDKK